MDYFFVMGGLILLVIAGDKLVDGAVIIAEHFQISKVAIGITVVSFGTSAPELVVGVDSALSGAPEIALGNVVGSNIANVFLVLGIPALFYPFIGHDPEAYHSLIAMILATFLLIGLSVFAPIYLWQGGLMLLLLGAFLAYSVKRVQDDKKLLRQESRLAAHALADISDEFVALPPLFRGVMMTVLGLAGLIFGAHILVSGAVNIAQTLGISEAVIGLTVVAIGTSLPELATSVMAARNRHGDVALGNVIGSNLFNILAIMGATALVAPVPVPESFFRVDFPIMVVSALILIPVVMGKIQINRTMGFVFSLFYFFYILFLAVQSNLLG